MSIKTSLQSMRAEAVEKTFFGINESVVYEEVNNVVVEVWADGASVMYVVKVGRELFATPNINICTFTLGYLL